MKANEDATFRFHRHADTIAARAGLSVPTGVHSFSVYGGDSVQRPLFVKCKRCKYALNANGTVRTPSDGACEE